MITFALATEKTTVDCLIVPLFQEKNLKTQVEDLDAVYDGALSRVIDLEDFEAKPMQSTLLYTGNKNAVRMLLIGLGKKSSLSVRSWKQTVGAAVVAAQGKKYVSLGMLVPEYVKKELGVKLAAQHTVVATSLASYAFDTHKSDAEEKVTQVQSVHVYGIEGSEKRAWGLGVVYGEKLAEAINNTRHLANTPPSVIVKN